ncbi:hypothetical protein ES703_58620 [subsurface metagenome]
MDVGQFLFQLQQAQTLFDVIAVVTKAPCLPGELFVVGGYHTAFAAGGKRLVLAEAAGGDVADGSGFSALIDTAKSLGVVLDDKKIVLFCEVEDLVHIADIAVKMHRHNRPGPLVDELLGRLDTDTMVVDIHIGKTWNCPGLHD